MKKHLLWLGLLLLAGCDARRPTSATPDFRHLASLPGLAKVADPSLQDEYARLVAEEATPAQLVEAAAPREEISLAQLKRTLPPTRVTTLLADIAAIYPAERFAFSAVAIERARELLRREQAMFDQAQAESAAPLAIDHAQGLLADMYLVDVAELAARSDALAAAVALEDGELAAAAAATERMLRGAHRLACVPHLTSRLKGAELRLSALQIVEVLVQDPAATNAMLARFREQLAEQLAAWPPDADAWRGDRAAGLHTYEMVRDGHVLSLISPAEIKELERGMGVGATARAMVQTVDDDERYYLATMRALLAACERPFHERQGVLRSIEEKLRDESAPDYPLIAGRMLLADIALAQRRQALDRATCEGWLIALSHATGAPAPPYTHNPLTGVAYDVTQERLRIRWREARGR